MRCRDKLAGSSKAIASRMHTDMTTDGQSSVVSSQRDAERNLSKGWALKAFQQGFDAVNAGKAVTDNPNVNGSHQAVMWEGGWQTGESGRQ